MSSASAARLRMSFTLCLPVASVATVVLDISEPTDVCEIGRTLNWSSGVDGVSWLCGTMDKLWKFLVGAGGGGKELVMADAVVRAI